MRGTALGLLCGALIGCRNEPIAQVIPVDSLPMDSLAFVLWVAQETSSILNDAIFRENAAIPSLLAVGGPLVAVGDSFPGILGRTFVWDTEASDYQPDDTRSDAPSGGTRFVLYDADPDNRVLRLPLTEIGHVDVVPEGGGHSVRAVVGAATVLDFFSSVTIPDTVYHMPCCSYAVLGRFPRKLSVAGTIWLGEMAVLLSYADTITGWAAVTTSGQLTDAVVSDIRRLHLLFPARGTAQFRSAVNSSVHFVDSDNSAEFRVAFPAQFDQDSIRVAVQLDGVRGYGIRRITINGKGDLLVVSDCEGRRCYRYHGEPIDTAQIQMLDEAILRSASMMIRPAYARFGILEAILAPAIFAVRD